MTVHTHTPISWKNGSENYLTIQNLINCRGRNNWNTEFYKGKLLLIDCTAVSII